VTTDIVAVAGAPLPASLDVTALVVLFCVPVAVAVTLMLKVQEAFALRPALANVMLLDPGAAVIDPVPQLPLNPLVGLATIKPAGKGSLKPMPLNAIEFGFVIVKLSVVFPLIGIAVARNDLENVGGPITVTFAVLLPWPVQGGLLQVYETGPVAVV
jgi:hypothetical protein